MNTLESWKSIEGWPYEASSLGRIRRSSPGPRTRVGSIVTGVDGGRGYLQVTLVNNGVRRSARVARLVCEAFHGERPAGKEVAHRNGIRGDNRPGNLYWATKAENAADRERHGHTYRGAGQSLAKTTDSAVREIRAVYDAATKKHLPNGVAAALCQKYGLSYSRVRSIALRKCWKHLD